MADLVKFIQRNRTGALSGRVWRDPIWMLGFDALEFVEQFVVFRIADDGRVEDVIAMVVIVNLVFEFFVTSFHGLIIVQ